MKKKKPASNITITVSRSQAGLLSEVCETMARIGLGQFDRLLSWTRDAQGMPLMGYEASTQVEKLTDGVRNTNPRGHRSEQSELNWDMHQVLRHRLSWEDAFRNGLVEEDGSRNWTKMMAVIYDEPLKRSKEPLLVIQREGDDQYRLVITKLQRDELLHGIVTCSDMIYGDASKAIETLYADQSAGKVDNALSVDVNSLLKDLRGLDMGSASEKDQAIIDKLGETKMLFETTRESKYEHQPSAGYEPT